MNKRGQIATTLHWIVATLIIVVILTFFFFFTKSFSGVKGISTERLASSSVDPKTTDVFLTQSFSAYLLSEEKGKTMYLHIKDYGNIDDISGPFISKVFHIPYPYVNMYVLKLSENQEIPNRFVDYYFSGEIESHNYTIQPPLRSAESVSESFYIASSFALSIDPKTRIMVMIYEGYLN